MKGSKGSIAISGLIFITISLGIILLVIAIFLSHINNILYSVKVDMYAMNRSAILAVNKNKANIDVFSYNKKAYEDKFIECLKMAYELDDNLTNSEKLITKINIKEYEIYEKRERDAYTRKDMQK